MINKIKDNKDILEGLRGNYLIFVGAQCDCDLVETTEVHLEPPCMVSWMGWGCL